jgi:hypothetical protein
MNVKKIFRRHTLVILIVVAMITLSWALDDEWKKIGESEGIIGYTRPTTKSSVDEIKAVGIVDAPVAVIEAVMRDISVMPEYVYLCKAAFLMKTPDMKSGGDVIIFYSLTDLPFPASDRDAVVRSMWTIDRVTGIVYCHAEGLETTFEQGQDIVRIPLSIMDCTLVPRGKNRTEVIYQILGHPGGELPSWFVKMLSRDYGIKTIAGLRKMVKKDKYKNVKKIVTTTPHVKK